MSTPLCDVKCMVSNKIRSMHSNERGNDEDRCESCEKLIVEEGCCGAKVAISVTASHVLVKS